MNPSKFKGKRLATSSIFWSLATSCTFLSHATTSPSPWKGFITPLLSFTFAILGKSKISSKAEIASVFFSKWLGFLFSVNQVHVLSRFSFASFFLSLVFSFSPQIFDQFLMHVLPTKSQFSTGLRLFIDTAFQRLVPESKTIWATWSGQSYII